VYLVCTGEEERAKAYSQQSALMAKTATHLMEDISGKQASFTSATHVEHVRPMFKVCTIKDNIDVHYLKLFKVGWKSFLAAFCRALCDSDDQEIVSLCLDGFRSAIHVSCVFGLQVLTYKLFFLDYCLY